MFHLPKAFDKAIQLAPAIVPTRRKSLWTSEPRPRSEHAGERIISWDIRLLAIAVQ